MRNSEIPEDIFQSEFGGHHLRRAMDDQRSRRASSLALSGIVMVVLGPVVLTAAGVVIATLMYCNWGLRC